MANKQKTAEQIYEETGLVTIDINILYKIAEKYDFVDEVDKWFDELIQSIICDKSGDKNG